MKGLSTEQGTAIHSTAWAKNSGILLLPIFLTPSLIHKEYSHFSNQNTCWILFRHFQYYHLLQSHHPLSHCLVRLLLLLVLYSVYSPEQPDGYLWDLCQIILFFTEIPPPFSHLMPLPVPFPLDFVICFIMLIINWHSSMLICL